MKLKTRIRENSRLKVRLPVFFIFFSILYFFTPGISPAEFSPDRTLFNPYTNENHYIQDIRSQFIKSSIAKDKQEMPVPGGKGAGVIYKNGSLQALEHAELHTKMFVYPDGLNPSGSLNWLYTTATNRTDDSIEVVGMYAGWKKFGYLGIWDWSCTADYPCQNGSFEPGFQWTAPFSEFECNMTEIVDKGGHYQTIIQYANISKKKDEGDPPLWRHEVMLWNFCNGGWDLIYEHESRFNKLDCSLANNTCAFWGPLLETFGDDAYPEINELGFEDTLLYHDGIWSELTPDEASFVNPITPWELFHLDPNRDYGVGNYVIFAPPAASFSADITSGEVPVSVHFSDESLWSISDWRWDFGDGAVSTEKNPEHVYDNPGSYTVSLTVTGPGGTDKETKIDYIVAGHKPPVADFTADTVIGNIPHMVHFTDVSSGTVGGWLWHFGDGKASTAQNPQNIYSASGMYDVSLTVTGPGGSDTEIKASYITVTGSDSDHDGIPDHEDGCISDPVKTDPGACGCGIPDTDSDGDGIPDCNDRCPNDPNNDADHDNICGDMDCNDNDAHIFPGATEICGDGIDQDCDGSDLACPGNDGDDKETPAAADTGSDDGGGGGCFTGTLLKVFPI